MMDISTPEKRLEAQLAYAAQYGHPNVEDEELLLELRSSVGYHKSHLDYARKNLPGAHPADRAFWQDRVEQLTEQELVARVALQAAQWGYEFPVPVELGLPTPGEPVLVYLRWPNGKKKTVVTSYDENIGRFLYALNHYITHWMYIQEPRYE